MKKVKENIVISSEDKEKINHMKRFVHYDRLEKEEVLKTISLKNHLEKGHLKDLIKFLDELNLQIGNMGEYENVYFKLFAETFDYDNVAENITIKLYHTVLESDKNYGKRIKDQEKRALQYWLEDKAKKEKDKKQDYEIYQRLKIQFEKETSNV